MYKALGLPRVFIETIVQAITQAKSTDYSYFCMALLSNCLCEICVGCGPVLMTN